MPRDVLLILVNGRDGKRERQIAKSCVALYVERRFCFSSLGFVPYTPPTSAISRKKLKLITVCSMFHYILHTHDV